MSEDWSWKGRILTQSDTRTVNSSFKYVLKTVTSAFSPQIQYLSGLRKKTSPSLLTEVEKKSPPHHHPIQGCVPQIRNRTAHKSRQCAAVLMENVCVCHVCRCQSGREAQRDPRVSHSSMARARVRFLWGEKAAVLTAHSNLAAPWDAETINHFREAWKAGLVPLRHSIASARTSRRVCFGSLTRRRADCMFLFLLLSRYLQMPWTKLLCFSKECSGSPRQLRSNGEHWEKNHGRTVLLWEMAFLSVPHSAGRLAGMSAHTASGGELHQTPQSQATYI